VKAVAAIAGMVLALAAAQAVAQGRGATAAQARAYIHGAFLTQAAPGILSDRVKLGIELEQRLKLPADAGPGRIYEALMALTDNQPFEVRRATAEELSGYGARPGLSAELPVYALEAGSDLRLLVQYDLQANNIPFIGLFGAPNPSGVLAAPAPAKPVAVATSTEPKKPATLTLVWTEQFEYKSTRLTPAARAQIDRDVLPKLKDFIDIRYINVSGHADRVGSSTYNQRLSERRAQAVRTYLVNNGADGDKIEVFGFGKTMPAKPCPELKRKKALLECLAPNRRVQIEIQGTLK
jgi:outer membrane protein OmpA-like peptidoglycan-associated protein